MPNKVITSEQQHQKETKKVEVILPKSKFEALFKVNKCYMWLAPEIFSVIYETKLKEMFNLRINNNYFIVASESELKHVLHIAEYPHPLGIKWGIKINIRSPQQVEKYSKIIFSRRLDWNSVVLLISTDNYKTFAKFNTITSVLVKHKVQTALLSCSFLSKNDITFLAYKLFKNVEKPALVHLHSMCNNAPLVYECLSLCRDTDSLTLDIAKKFKDTSATFEKYINSILKGYLGLKPDRKITEVGRSIREAKFIKRTYNFINEFGFWNFKTKVKRYFEELYTVIQLKTQGEISPYVKTKDLDKLRESRSGLRNISDYKLEKYFELLEGFTLKEILSMYILINQAYTEEEYISTLYKIGTRYF